MDWKDVRKTGENGGGGRRAELPIGTHLVKISKVTTRKKDGTLITTKDGDPQLAVTLSNNEGEISYFAPVSGSQAWKFSALISAACSDADLDALTLAGVSPNGFLADAICRVYLLGRSVVAKGRRRGDFVNWDLSQDTSGNSSAGQTVGHDDVPF